jgi:hypothetical protein
VDYKAVKSFESQYIRAKIAFPETKNSAYLFTYCLFKDAVSISDHAALNGPMIHE